MNQSKIGDLKYVWAGISLVAGLVGTEIAATQLINRIGMPAHEHLEQVRNLQERRSELQRQYGWISLTVRLHGTDQELLITSDLEQIAREYVTLPQKIDSAQAKADSAIAANSFPVRVNNALPFVAMGLAGLGLSALLYHGLYRSSKR